VRLRRDDLRLATRAPFDGASIVGFLAARAIPGLEEWDGRAYRRSLRLEHGAGVAELSPEDSGVRCSLELDDGRDFDDAVARLRRLFDLDADPVAVEAALGGDPFIGRFVSRSPGRRVPGSVDPPETAFRAVIGQQISVPGARTIAGRLVERFGEPIATPVGGVTRLFPTATALLGAEPADLPMPGARQIAIKALAAALAGGGLLLDPAGEPDETERRLVELPGIGPWTAGYIRMRALGDGDAFLPSDLGVRRSVAALGGPSRPADIATLAEAWRPWRAYALMHLWAFEAG
jgi:AraC family transcriptional regulator, regulatory protein of adaptative response / DNA-3-methyladenine glycosylase II